MARLRARADTAYDNAYHGKLRGRIWRALEGTEFEEYHDENRPLGLCFSNPFPPRDMAEGESRTLLVSATDRDLLGAVAENFDENRELNIGEMPFEISDLSTLTPDVGEPGTRGVLETGTGVIVRIPPWKAEEYGVETDGTHATFWQPDHGMEPLQVQVENNLDRKHDLFCPDDLPGPTDRDGDLFESYELLKTFALPVLVTEGEEMTYVASKWRFGYRVRDDHHRRHLNLLLDAGIAERNMLGFGFLNVDQDAKRLPGHRTAAGGRGSVEQEGV